MDIKASGIEPGQRRLNGLQTTGREYRNLSQPTLPWQRMMMFLCSCVMASTCWPMYIGQRSPAAIQS
jgi:hypothetical protein